MSRNSSNQYSIYSEVNSADDESILKETYHYTLIVILLEYMAEPRFHVNSTGAPQPLRDEMNQKSRSGEFLLREQSSIGSYQNSSSAKDYLLVALTERLSLITRNQIKVTDPNFKRCLLKFYNDYFLDPNMKIKLKQTSNIEDIVAYFSQSANKELNKVLVDNFSLELYRQVASFLELLINCTPEKYMADFKPKLEAMKSTFEPNRYRPLTKRYSLDMNSNVPITAQRQPSWNLDDISHIGYFMKLFAMDKMKIQYDVNDILKHLSLSSYKNELLEVRVKVKNSSFSLSVSDFPTEREYRNWQNYIFGETTQLIDKFSSEQISNINAPTPCIPSNRKAIISKLFELIIQSEYKNDEKVLALSKESTFFIFKCAKYWLSDFPSTIASLFFAAMNKVLFTNDMLNVEFVEKSIMMVSNLFLRSRETKELTTWNNYDRILWVKTLRVICSKTFKSISILLSKLFDPNLPSFSPYLSFYFTIKYTDRYTEDYLKSTSFEKKWAESLRNNINRACQTYYQSLVSTLPRDETLEIQHIQDIAEKIYKMIEKLQKKYPKPMFEDVNIAFVVADFLINAFLVDLETMLHFVKHYHKIASKSIAPVDGLECYKAIVDLREIYVQIKPNELFPINLESMFGQYLQALNDDIKKRIMHVVKSSIKAEKWVRMNDATYYSTSIVDIFRLVNEAVQIFTKFDWEDQYEIAYLTTNILSEFTEGLKYYCSKLQNLAENDLQMDVINLITVTPESTPLSSGIEKLDKKGKTWSFHQMKRALKSKPSIMVPAPYEYTVRTCVILNNLDAMLGMITRLDELVKPQELSKYLSEAKAKPNRSTENSNNINHIFTIRVLNTMEVHADTNDGFSNLRVTLNDSNRKSELGSTRIIEDSLNPIWDEEFELRISNKEKAYIDFLVWHHSDAKNTKMVELCAKGHVVLDPKRFSDNGLPSEMSIAMSPKGHLNIHVTLETEKMDPLFCIGNAYRTALRSKEKLLNMIVTKFSTVVAHIISKNTLKFVKAEKKNYVGKDAEEVVYDAIVPLFDYLNSNLSILASELPKELLFEVILKAWDVILLRADSMLLPSLSSISSSGLVNSARKSIWRNSISSNPTISGFGKPLTEEDISIVFKWLDALCIDFFHNEGAGPSIENLKNVKYTNMLNIPKFYGTSVPELKKLILQLEKSYDQYLDHIYNQDHATIQLIRTQTMGVSRHATIMGSSTKATREQLKDIIKEEEHDPLKISADKMDVILRILLAKGEFHFVYKNLERRKKLLKKMENKRMARNAAMGKKAIQ